MKVHFVSIGLSALALVTSVQVHALHITCNQGASHPDSGRPYAPRVTLWAEAFWNSSDSVIWQINYMNTQAYGPGCSSVCNLTAADAVFQPRKKYDPWKIREQVLWPAAAGEHTLTSVTQGFNDDPVYGRVSATLAEDCMVRGAAAPSTGGGEGH